MNHVMEKVLGYYCDICTERNEILLKQFNEPKEAYTVDAILENFRRHN